MLEVRLNHLVRASRALAGLLLVGVLLSAFGVSAQDSASYYSVGATTQHFEQGQMIWRADVGTIYVLFDNGKASFFPSYLYGSLPDNPYFNTPPFRIRPIMGFGKVWGNYDFVRNGLGWAVTAERSYNMGYYVTYNGTQYITQYDGDIIEISTQGNWRYVDSAPVPLPTEPATPRITALTASDDVAMPGRAITIEWDTEGATDVALLVNLQNDAQTMIASYGGLRPGGSRIVALPQTLNDPVNIALWAWTGSQTVYANIVLPLQQNTGGETLQTEAAYQPFDGGFMLWRQDTEEVLAFFNGFAERRSWSRVGYINLPDNPVPAPRDNHIMPRNAFGKVWGNIQSVRDRLGWPTAQEIGYTMQIVQTAPELDGFGSDNITYSLPDGRRVQVTGIYWRYLPN